MINEIQLPHSDFTIWALVTCRAYPGTADENEFDEEIISMRKWCEEANISHTPFLFFNGKQLPETYTVEDLKYLQT